MKRQSIKPKLKEWLQRYARAELLGTFMACSFATVVYAHTHSYISAAGAGFVGEGLGFYGYFIVAEIRRHGLHYKGISLRNRMTRIFTGSSSLFIEFAPAEVFDTFCIRPLAMYIVPQHIKPYALGFIAGKVGADLVFYILVIAAYEAKKHWLHRP